MRGFLYGVTVVCALGLMAGSVNAAPQSRGGSNADSTEVSVEGVDFDDIRDVDAFYAKLRKAANRVCAVQVENSSEVKNETSACEQQALDWAVQDINKPLLSAHHKSAGQASSYAEAKPQS